MAILWRLYFFALMSSLALSFTEFCKRNVCANGGTCVYLPDGRFQCICPSGFSGKNCSINIDDCAENWCDNGSTCLDGIAKYTCLCPPGKIGLFCHLTDPCLDKPCKNGAQCVADTASGDFTCECAKGTTGPDCSTDVNECDQDEKLCFNDGICVNTFGSWYCDCPPGYIDAYCMIHENGCKPNPCINGGSCLDYGNRFQCICQDGFVGKICEQTQQRCVETLVNGSRNVAAHQRCTNESDIAVHERNVCTMHQCGIKANDGVCNSECNYYACNYDGGDCSAHVRPFRHCKQAELCARVFRNSKCDQVCNTAECLYDGFDCVEHGRYCTFESYCAMRFDDGFCDRECANSACAWDGNDCSRIISTKLTKLSGKLIVIVLVEPEEFLKRASTFLFVLSESMHVVVSIELNEQRRRMIFAWNTRDGIGLLTDNSDLAMAVNGYRMLDNNSTSSEREITGTIISGTLVFLTVSTADGINDNVHKLGDLNRVVDFMGALSTRNVLRDIGTPLYSAQAEIPVPAPKPTPENWSTFSKIVFLILMTIVILLIVFYVLESDIVGIGRNRRQKTVHVIKTWYPDSIKNYLLPTKKDGTENGDIVPNGVTATRGSGEPDNENGKVGSLPRKLDNWNLLHIQAWSDAQIDLTLLRNDLVNQKTVSGQTPLMLVSLNVKKRVETTIWEIEQLIAVGACLDEQDDDGETALIKASKSGRSDVVKCLLMAGANTKLVDDCGRTVLHHAVAVDDVDVVQEILQNLNGLDINAVDDTDCSPLITISKLGYFDNEIAELLLNAGANINCCGSQVNGECYRKRTALHFAAMQCNEALARLLIRRGAQINAQDFQGQTPMFLAASEGHIEIVHLLLENNARFDIADNIGRTPEQIADQKCFFDVRDILIKLREPIACDEQPRNVVNGSVSTTARTSTTQQKKQFKRSKVEDDNGNSSSTALVYNYLHV